MGLIIGAAPKAEDIWDAFRLVWESGFHVRVGPHPQDPLALVVDMQRAKKGPDDMPIGCQGVCPRDQLPKALLEMLGAIQAQHDAVGGIKKSGIIV